MLRRLLILALIPTVLLASQAAPASAKTVYGETTDTANVELDETNYWPNARASCNLSANYVRSDGALVPGMPGTLPPGITYQGVRGNVSCTGESGGVYKQANGNNSAYSSVTEDANYSTTLTFNGQWSDGTESCELTVTDTTNTPLDYFDGVAYTTNNSVTVTNERWCQVSEVCIDAKHRPDIPIITDPTFEYAGCESLTLGALPSFEALHPGTCSNGMPIRANTTRYELSGTFAGYHQHDFQITFATSPTLTWTGSGSGGGGWAFSARNSTYTEVDEFHEGEPILAGYGWSATAFNGPHDGTRHENATTPANHVPVGIQITDGRKTASYPTWLDTAAERTGLTVPQYCIFWFGPKIVNRPSDTYDEPAAAMGGTVGEGTPPDTTVTPPATPDDPNGGCDFDVTSPSTWLEGGMCSAVGLLGSVFEVLKDLLGAIQGLVAAIGDLLMTLFVPDPDSWGLSELIDQFKAKPPFSLISTLATEASGFGSALSSSGECGSLLDFGDGVEVTCTAVKNAPGMAQLYDVVRIGLICFTGLGLFRMFSGLFEDGQ